MVTVEVIESLHSLACRQDELIGQIEDAIDIDDPAAAALAIEELKQTTSALLERIVRLMPDML